MKQKSTKLGDTGMERIRVHTDSGAIDAVGPKEIAQLVLFLATTRAAVRICLVSFIFGLCCFVIKVAVFRI